MSQIEKRIELLTKLQNPWFGIRVYLVLLDALAEIKKLRAQVEKLS